MGTVISHIGSRHPVTYAPSNITGYSLGYLKASPNGQKLGIVSANGYGIAECFDFDKITGIVSNPVNLQTDSIYDYYGVSFSPDNSKLYISCVLNDDGVYQFNLNAGGGNADSVLASKTKIAGNSHQNWALSLGPDGKIYVATGGAYLSVINNPNNVGLSCNYKDSVVHVYGNVVNEAGLPNFIDSYDYSNTTCNCSDDDIHNVKLANNAILYQNSPNPFGNGTTIKYFVPENADAQIIFYDEFGTQIKTFKVSENGTGQLNIDASNLPQDIYSYSLIVNGKVVDTKKMLKSN